MATDFAYMFLVWPVLIGLGILLILCIKLPHTKSPTPLLTIGGRRLAHGYLGAMFAVLLYSYANALFIGFDKAARGEITRAQLPSWIPFWGFYLFVLTAPFVAIAVTVIGLPLFAALSRIRLASILGVALLATAFAFFVAVFVWLAPYNDWCEANIAACMGTNFLGAMFVSIAVGLGFSFAARLPLIRSAARANL